MNRDSGRATDVDFIVPIVVIVLVVRISWRRNSRRTSQLGRGTA